MQSTPTRRTRRGMGDIHTAEVTGSIAVSPTHGGPRFWASRHFRGRRKINNFRRRQRTGNTSCATYGVEPLRYRVEVVVEPVRVAVQSQRGGGVAERPLDGLHIRPCGDSEARCCVPEFVRRQTWPTDGLRCSVEPIPARVSVPKYATGTGKRPGLQVTGSQSGSSVWPQGSGGLAPSVVRDSLAPSPVSVWSRRRKRLQASSIPSTIFACGTAARPCSPAAMQRVRYGSADADAIKLDVVAMAGGTHSRGESGKPGSIGSTC